MCTYIFIFSFVFYSKASIPDALFYTALLYLIIYLDNLHSIESFRTKYLQVRKAVSPIDKSSLSAQLPRSLGATGIVPFVRTSSSVSTMACLLLLRHAVSALKRPYLQNLQDQLSGSTLLSYHMTKQAYRAEGTCPEPDSAHKQTWRLLVLCILAPSSLSCTTYVTNFQGCVVIEIVNFKFLCLALVPTQMEVGCGVAGRGRHQLQSQEIWGLLQSPLWAPVPSPVR